jgi:hypothetical protein
MECSRSTQSALDEYFAAQQALNVVRTGRELLAGAAEHLGHWGETLQQRYNKHKPQVFPAPDVEGLCYRYVSLSYGKPRFVNAHENNALILDIDWVYILSGEGIVLQTERQNTRKYCSIRLLQAVCYEVFKCDLAPAVDTLITDWWFTHIPSLISKRRVQQELYNARQVRLSNIERLLA